MTALFLWLTLTILLVIGFRWPSLLKVLPMGFSMSSLFDAAFHKAGLTVNKQFPPFSDSSALALSLEKFSTASKILY